MFVCVCCGGGPVIEGSNAGLDSSMSDAYLVSDGAGGAYVISTDDDALCQNNSAVSPVFNTHLATWWVATAAPGTYAVADGHAQADARAVYIGACAHQPATIGMSGTITITRVDGTSAAPTHISGSVNVQFEGGGELHGSFEATTCPGDPSTFVPYYIVCY